MTIVVNQNIIVLKLFFAWWHSTNHDDFDILILTFFLSHCLVHLKFEAKLLDALA